MRLIPVAPAAIDPERLRERAEWEAERQRRAEKFRIGEAPVVQALREAGLEINSIWDLVNSNKPYPDAIPVLVRQLSMPHSSEVRGSIARALAVKEARSAWPIFATAYRNEPNHQGGLTAKDGLACALSATVTNETIDELISIAKDASHDGTRVLLLYGIRRSRTPQAKQAIIDLASDPALAKEIGSWRRRKA